MRAIVYQERSAGVLPANQLLPLLLKQTWASSNNALLGRAFHFLSLRLSYAYGTHISPVHISCHVALHARSLTRSRFLRGISMILFPSLSSPCSHHRNELTQTQCLFHFLIPSYACGPHISKVLFSSYFSPHGVTCQIDH